MPTPASIALKYCNSEFYIQRSEIKLILHFSETKQNLYPTTMLVFLFLVLVTSSIAESTGIDFLRMQPIRQMMWLKKMSLSCTKDAKVRILVKAQYQQPGIGLTFNFFFK